MLYGSAAWDPVLIISQIISLQCLFYLTLGLAQVILLSSSVPGHITINNMFNWRTMDVHSYNGWMTIAADLGTSCLGAVYLMWIVERAKKCLDFASTIFLLHMTFCWIYSGFPASFVWWLSNGVGLLITALLGEWLCVQREMADIPLNALRGRGGVGTVDNRVNDANQSERDPLLEMTQLAVNPSSSSSSCTSLARISGTAVAVAPRSASARSTTPITRNGRPVSDNGDMPPV